jgi:hypothetical protein
VRIFLVSVVAVMMMFPFLDGGVGVLTRPGRRAGT